MPKYVDVEKVFCADCEDRDKCGYPDVFCDVHSMPAKDVAPVVRCKDCKHLMFSDFYGECGAGYYGIVRPEHFCSYGERKDGGKDD